MVTPLEFYVEKATELGVPLSDLCDLVDLNFQSDEIPKVTIPRVSVSALDGGWGGIDLCHISVQNPNRIGMLASTKQCRPNSSALANAPGRIREIDDVVHRDYWFAMHDYNEREKNNFLEFTVTQGVITSSKIDPAQLSSRNSGVQIPSHLFAIGRDYGKGLTWMLELYACR